MAQAREFGEGILFRVTTTIYALVMLTLLFATTCVLFIPTLFLAHDVSNLVFFSLAALPVGPGITALLHCITVLGRDRDISPTREFFRAYRMNFAPTLRFWIPAVVVGAIVAADVGYLQGSDSGFDAAVFVALLVLSAIGVLWLVNMFVITAHFHFRFRDAAKLSVFYLGARPLATLANVATIFVLGACFVFAFDAVAVILSCLFAYMAVTSNAPTLRDVRQRFTAPADSPVEENSTATAASAPLLPR